MGIQNNPVKSINSHGIRLEARQPQARDIDEIVRIQSPQPLRTTLPVRLPRKC
jgi:hypothetical protein